MQKNIDIKKIMIRPWLLTVMLGLSGLICFGQVSVSGPICVHTGVQYTYQVSAYYSGTSNFNYTVSGGTLSTGGTTGSHSGPGSTSIIVTWTSSGSISVTCTAGYYVLSVTLTAALSAGSITSGQNQNITYNTTPAAINCSAATGGPCSAPNYVYQWQQSPDNVNFANLSGATSQNLTFSSPATETFYYRRFVTETTTNTTGYSPTASLIVTPPGTILPVVPGSITPATQTINYNTTAPTLSSTGVGGGTYAYTYQWQSSPDNATWNNVASAVTTYSPGNLTATTYFRVAVTSYGTTAYSSSALVNVYPMLKAGLVTPRQITIVSGGNPGGVTCAAATGGNGTYTYQWQNSTDGINFTNISSTPNLYYTPGSLTVNTWYRIAVTSNGVTAYSGPSQVIISTSTPDMNYVRVREIHKAGVTDTLTAAGLTSVYDVSQTTQYFDGLGRQVQTVGMQQSPLMKDLVSFVQYDGFGREASKFLPYTASTNDGNYKVTSTADQYNFNAAQFPGEQYYYGQVNFEPSPLNRVISSMSPGLNWEGASRGTSAQYQVNTNADSVRIWNIANTAGSIPTSSAMYSPGTLYKNVSIDEAGHSVIEYKDREGKSILKKVQLAASPGTAHAGWLCTYYIYDISNHLRFVIQPQAVVAINSTWTISTTIANELCFRYEYDQRHRMIIKKIPGAGEAWMVYDYRNRLVMTQDSALRSLHKWLFTKYDTENRPDSTGLITDPSNYNNLAYHQNLAMNSTNYPSVGSYTNQILTQTFYDDYSWVSTYGNPVNSSMYTGDNNLFLPASNTTAPYPQALTTYNITRGFVTGSRVNVLGSTTQYLYSVNFFDDRGRILQNQSPNITGCNSIKDYQYSFSGNKLGQYELNQDCNGTSPAIGILSNYDYDHASRLLDIKKTIYTSTGVGNTPVTTIAQYTYNELGQLREKILGNNLDSLVYDYNIRGWLIGINKNYVAGTANHYFGMELGYDKNTSSAPGNTYTTQEFNGNIEGTVWKTAGSAVNRKYDFTYDNVNRLTAAVSSPYFSAIIN
jgi:uncharacterized protein DUF6443